jgi:DNA-binding transcriptional regulator WhiA
VSPTVDVKSELAAVRDPRPTARVAELTAILRFSGDCTRSPDASPSRPNWRPTCSRVVSPATSWSSTGCARAAPRPGVRRTRRRHFAVRVIEGGETLARQTGLLDRVAVRCGAAEQAHHGRAPDLAAVWRGAFLASGTLSDPGRSAALEIACPSGEAAMALVGAAHRIGIAAKAREVRGVPRVVVRDGEAIRVALAEMGAVRTAQAWEEMRQRREVRAGVNRLVNFDDANLRRSAQAAVAACARVERALEILGEEVPITCAKRASCACRTATRASTSSATTPIRR